LALVLISAISSRNGSIKGISMASRAEKTSGDMRDSLTGLADDVSARATITRWQRDWHEAAEKSDGQEAEGSVSSKTTGECPLHAMLVELGRIETVNVAFGETAGDGALIEVAQRIRHFATDELESGVWLAARISGGSFLLVAHGECSRERWEWLAEALADAIALPINNPSANGTLRLSPRIVLMRATSGSTADTMLDVLAEGARRLRNIAGQRITWEGRQAASVGRTNHQLEADLLAAIDRDEIEVVFQPQYRVTSDRLIGAEALARWEHPEVGRIGAGLLFSIAERADFVTQLSRQIAKTALKAAALWPADLRVSINVTPQDLAASSFARDFTALVEESGVAAARVTLEITEHVALADLERAREGLTQLREAGMSLALDDFGAGFCNFHYLKMLPVNQLKLDQSMVSNIDTEGRDLAIFRAIMALARAMDMRVTAEGVEFEWQLDKVREEGCETYQGFLREEPMSPAKFLALAEE
jgi:EAL domain-containing protein (putative c-di-GMP-specific phosphodiesterase class I)/GGDEF domain-containing protein